MKSLAGVLATLLLCASPFHLAAAQTAGTPKAETPKAETPGLVPEDSRLLIVFASPVAGQEAAFNAWYDQHMRDFMKFPNFVRVQKFKMLSRKGRPDPEYQYMFVFEFKGDQDESFARIQAAIKDGRLPLPDSKVVAKLSGMNYGADGAGYRGPAAE